MKYLIFVIYFLPLCLYAQTVKNDTIYILYNKYTDEHSHEKHKVHYFKICVDNKYVEFGYGSAIKIKKTKKLLYPITDRDKLSIILANDSFDKRNAFFIVEKVNDYYWIRKADYRFRVDLIDNRESIVD